MERKKSRKESKKRKTIIANPNSLIIESRESNHAGSQETLADLSINALDHKPTGKVPLKASKKNNMADADKPRNVKSDLTMHGN